MTKDARGADTAAVRPGRRIAMARLRDLALIPAIIAIAIVGQIVNPVFLQPDNLINVLQTMSEIALLVLAQTIVLIVEEDGPVAGVHHGPGAGRRRLADRAGGSRARPGPAAGRLGGPGHPGRRPRSSASSTPC